MDTPQAPTVALAIIAKDESEQLSRIIYAYSKYFDEVHIAYDKEEARDATLDAKATNVFFHKYEWCDDFAHKRNFLAGKIKCDYYVRLDTDDALVGAENIREMIGNMARTNTDLVMCLYNYGHDENGNVDIAHYRETIIKNTHTLEWRGRIHEAVCSVDPRGIAFYKDEDNQLVIDHLSDKSHRVVSVYRNLKILKDEYEKTKDNPDPRIIAYLGRSLFDVGEYEDAAFYLGLHIKKSGWDEDRYCSLIYLAQAYFCMNDNENAVETLMHAINERPEFPEAYGRLCEFYHGEEANEKAINYGKLAIFNGSAKTNMAFDPTLITWKVPLFMAICSIRLGKYEDGIKLFNVAREVAPKSNDIVRLSPMFDMLADERSYMEHLLHVIKVTKKYEDGKVVDLVRSIPSVMDKNDMIADLKNYYLPPKKWGENSIVIYCGNTDHVWTPADTKTGIGGSEEATIHLSRELTKLGYSVTVFNNCVDEYDDYGVKYIPYNLFNRNDDYNILIGWRQNVAMHDIRANRHIMWIHDLPRDKMLREDQIKNLDVIVVLSEYHKTLIPEHAQHLCVVSTNGINQDDFVGADIIEKQPKRIIYASSYDRGLDKIVENWPTIKEAEPDAELHIFYGWNTYDDYIKAGLTSKDFKDKMVELFKQDGIYEHGRIGHKELIEEYAKSSVYAYACNYSGEINCIALTKAKATNCNIVTNDFAVLGERSPNSVTDDKFIDGIIEQLKKEPKEGLDTQYIDDMSWAKVAEQWHEDILCNTVH